MGALLGLAVFVGGGTWCRGQMIPIEEVRAYSGLYLIIVALFLLGFSVQPFYLISRLVNGIIRKRR
jgi:hypothetical protein